MENYLESLSVGEKEKEVQQENFEKDLQKVQDELSSVVENSVDVKNLVKELNSLKAERDKLVKQIEKLKSKLSSKKKPIKKAIKKTVKKAVKKKVTKKVVKKVSKKKVAKKVSKKKK